MTAGIKPRAGSLGVLALALLLLLAGTGPVPAHEEHVHDEAEATPAETGEATEPTSDGAAPEPFPADIGGAFALVDHNGTAVTDADFLGRYLLVFFGYARCDSICPVGLKRMTEAVDLLGTRGDALQPLLITVDPENDTPEVLAEHLPTIHSRLIGLTGEPDAVAAAQKSYKVSSKQVGQSWKGNPIISHGSYIYLMGRDGKLVTILPPVLSAQAMAEIIGRYIS